MSKFYYSYENQNNSNSRDKYNPDQNRKSNDNYNDNNRETLNYEDFPIIKYLFSKNIKTKKLPCFEVYSSQIEILNQPMDFYLAIIVFNIFIIFIIIQINISYKSLYYSHLLINFKLPNKKLIRSANERITISSLYLGIGKMEELVIEELLRALKKNPNLKITILLDRGRGNFLLI